jgi:hypothetical protein
MEKATLYPDLKPIADRASYKQIFDLLYIVAQVRYATFKQLNHVNYRVATKNNLADLVSLDYLATINLVKNAKAFHITDKTRQILEREGFNVKIIQKKLTGHDLKHALKITECLLKLQAQDYFYNVFYYFFKMPPNYDGEFLRPDACVVWKKDGAYKIEFIEVEEEKPNWGNYLLVKREKYEKLARDPNIYRIWWKGEKEEGWHKKLNLPICQEADFCFSVVCFGNIKKEWNGWNWMTK